MPTLIAWAFTIVFDRLVFGDTIGDDTRVNSPRFLLSP